MRGRSLLTEARPEKALALLRRLAAAAQGDMRAAAWQKMAEINANTPTSVSLLHGSAAGKRVLVHVPRAVRLNPTYSEFEGIALF